MDADSGLNKRETSEGGADFLNQFTLDDSDSFITSDAGGPIQDDTSLKAGVRGPTLLEDFIFRQKIQHFDHERVGTFILLPTPQIILGTSSINYLSRCLNVLFMLVVLVSTDIPSTI